MPGIEIDDNFLRARCRVSRGNYVAAPALQRNPLAWATFPRALRSFDVLLNLPKLDGVAGSGCTRLPLSFFFLLFHLFVAMRLDGEEQGRAYDEELERNKDDRNPIHDFLDTLRQQPGQWFKPNRMPHGMP